MDSISPNYYLSIPCVVFLIESVDKFLLDIGNFQFPLLGSEYYTGSTTEVFIGFQFPLLGSLRVWFYTGL